MTIIQPSKNKNLIHLMLIFGAILTFVAGLYVFIYSRTVNLTHDLKKIEAELIELRVQNADLKNGFYSAIDSKKLEDLAQEKGLIIDRNPQWEFASHF